VLFAGAAALVTVGFWGMAVSLGRADFLLAGAVCLVAGIVFLGFVGEWSFSRWQDKRRTRARMETLARVGDLDRRLKALEKERETELESADKSKP